MVLSLDSPLHCEGRDGSRLSVIAGDAPFRRQQLGTLRARTKAAFGGRLVPQETAPPSLLGQLGVRNGSQHQESRETPMSNTQQTATQSPAMQSPLAVARRQLLPALLAALTLGVFANLAALAMPLYSIQVYDRVLTSRNLTTLTMVTLITGFVLAVNAALDCLRAAVLNRISVGIDRTLSEPAFDAVLRAHLAKPTTDAVRAFRDVASIRDFIASGGVAAFLDLPRVPIFVALSFAIHPALGAVAVCSTILVGAAALASEALTRTPLLAAAQHLAQAQRHSTNTLRDAETISVLGMQVRAVGLCNVLLYLTKFVRSGVQIAIMGVAAYLVIDGAIQAGVIFAASLIIGRALAP